MATSSARLWFKIFRSSCKGVIKDNNVFKFRRFHHKIRTEATAHTALAENSKRNQDSRKSSRLLYLPALLGYFWKKYDETDDDKNPPDEITMLIKRGVLSHIQKDYEKSEEYFHDALIAIEEKFKIKGFESDVLYLTAKINVFTRLAAMEMTRSNYEKAESLYKETMRLCFATGVEENDNSIVELSFKLATLYAMKGDKLLANVGFEHCIDTQNEKIEKIEEPSDDSLALLGMASEGYGRYLIQHKRYKDADKHFRVAVNIGRKLYGPTHAQTMVLVNNVAIVGIFQGKYDATKRLLLDNIAIGEVEKSEEIGALWSNLGAVYLRMKDLDEAYRACSEAVRYGEVYGNEEMVDTAKVCLRKVEDARKKNAQSKGSTGELSPASDIA